MRMRLGVAAVVSPGLVVLASFLEPRRRSEQTRLAVLQQAHVCGVSTTRRVDQLVESLGADHRSDVSRVYPARDEEIDALPTRLHQLIGPLDP